MGAFDGVRELTHVELRVPAWWIAGRFPHESQLTRRSGGAAASARPARMVPPWPHPPAIPRVTKLAYDEGKKAVADQAATLKETRDRVGTLDSAAAVVAGLAAALAFNSGRVTRLTAWGAIATVTSALGFAAISVAAVMIWRPFPGTFTLDAGTIVGSYVEGDPPAALSEIHRELALHLGTHSAYNRDLLDRRLTWFVVALQAFLVEIVALMLVLWDAAA